MGLKAFGMTGITRKTAPITFIAETKDPLAKKLKKRFQKEWIKELQAAWSDADGGISFTAVDRVLNSMRYV